MENIEEKLQVEFITKYLIGNIINLHPIRNVETYFDGKLTGNNMVAFRANVSEIELYGFILGIEKVTESH